MFSTHKTIAISYLPQTISSTYEKHIQVTNKSINDVIDDYNTPKNKSIESINQHKQTYTKTYYTTNTPLASSVAFISAKFSSISNSYNVQANNYINALTTEQARLNQQNIMFLEKQYANNTNPTVLNLRNKTDWSDVKNLVVRDELMKIQMGGDTNLPITQSQYNDLANKINNIDLSNMNDARINSVINDILKPNEQIYIDALKLYKEKGIISEYFQTSKIQNLQEYLKDIDLNNITSKELKYLKNNFFEKVEIHHRTSISSDPTIQSDINNLDTLNTSQHNQKHTDPDTGKINYKRRLNEEPLDRIQELKNINKKRVLMNELKGIGIAAAIGLGTGFAIGFIVSLAQNGLNPSSLKHAFVAGAHQGGASALTAAGGALIGALTHGATESLAHIIANRMGIDIASEAAKNISTMCSMGVVGTLTTIVFAVINFAILKRQGYNTKECLLRTRNTTALSFTILIVSICLQGAFGGHVGMVVSIVAGVIITGVTIWKIFHNKKVFRQITYYSIELCKPKLQIA